MTDPTVTAAGAANMRRARRHLETELDRLCTRNGLDAWETWRKPRRLEALAGVTAVANQIRDTFGGLTQTLTAELTPMFDAIARDRDAEGRWIR